MELRMGKSDPIIFAEYARILEGVQYKSIAFLGFTEDNVFAKSLKAEKKDFYDLSLGNWNINDDWKLKQTYDLIVCTRCPYFARDPKLFVAKCREHLNPNGHALLDWGLGDHWRFSNFKVGWIRDGEHEFAYRPDNFLYSCFWRSEFADHPVVKQFWSHVSGKFGYSQSDDINSVIRLEVPVIVDYDFKAINFKFLWPDAPQLYIVTLL